MLRSGSCSLLTVRNGRTVMYGEISFDHQPDRLWNMMPNHIKPTPSKAILCKVLKTYLFNSVYIYYIPVNRCIRCVCAI